MKRPIEVSEGHCQSTLPLLDFFSGRSHSAVHNINNGLWGAVFKLCKAAGSTIHGGTRVCQALKQQQKSVIATANVKERTHLRTLCAERDVHCIAYMKKSQEEINYRKNMMQVPIHNKKCHRDHTNTKADGPKAKQAKYEYDMQ